jgi:hypothetical protein
VEIINTPITWEQYLQILERRQVNQKLSSRNGKREYLLRGFIKCYTHYGKKGEPRTYYGKPSNGSYIYTCPIGGCAHPNLNGPRIEERVKQDTWWLLNLQPEDFYNQIGNQDNVDETRESLRKELASLEARYRSNIAAETKLEDKDSRGLVQPEVYRELKDSYQRERIAIEERKEAIEQQLEQLNRQAEIASTWWELTKQVTGRLEQLTNAEWRGLFIALNLEVHVRDRYNPETWRDGWYLDENGLLRDKGALALASMPRPLDEVGDLGIEICFGLPVKVGAEVVSYDVGAEVVRHVGEIVFNRPCPSPSA